MAETKPSCEIQRFMAAGPWITRDLKEAVLASDHDAVVDRLRAALKSAGDDYPGSSFQKWCYEQAGIPLSASPKLGEVLQQIRAERATSPTDAGQEQ